MLCHLWQHRLQKVRRPRQLGQLGYIKYSFCWPDHSSYVCVSNKWIIRNHFFLKNPICTITFDGLNFRNNLLILHKLTIVTCTLLFTLLCTCILSFCSLSQIILKKKCPLFFNGNLNRKLIVNRFKWLFVVDVINRWSSTKPLLLGNVTILYSYVISTHRRNDSLSTPGRRYCSHNWW